MARQNQDILDQAQLSFHLSPSSSINLDQAWTRPQLATPLVTCQLHDQQLSQVQVQPMQSVEPLPQAKLLPPAQPLLTQQIQRPFQSLQAQPESTQFSKADPLCDKLLPDHSLSLRQSLESVGQVTTHQSSPTSFVPAPIVTSPQASPISSSPQSNTSHSTHSMLTRSKAGIIKPNPKYLYVADVKSSIPVEPKSITAALKHPDWVLAMQEEISALDQNQTWELVPQLPSMNVVGCRWVFKTKLRLDGSLAHLKARLVAKGFQKNHTWDIVSFPLNFKPIGFEWIYSIKLRSDRLLKLYKS